MVGKCSLSVIEAKDLRAADRSGLSDPFVVITHGSTKMKSSVVKQTLNPVWNEDFNFDLDPSVTGVTVSLFDADFLGKEFLGEVSFDVRDLLLAKERDDWFPLRGRPGKKDFVRGSIRLMIRAFGMSVDSIARTSASGSTSPASKSKPAPNVEVRPLEVLPAAVVGASTPNMREVGSDFERRRSSSRFYAYQTAIVQIVESSDLLNETVDAFAEATFASQSYRTSTIMNNMHPKWNERFVFNVAKSPTSELAIDVYNRRLVGANDHLGSVRLDLIDFADGCEHDLRLPLEPIAPAVARKSLLTKIMPRTPKPGAAEFVNHGSIRVLLTLSETPYKAVDKEIKKVSGSGEVNMKIFDAVYMALCMFVTLLLAIFCKI